MLAGKHSRFTALALSLAILLAWFAGRDAIPRTSSAFSGTGATNATWSSTLDPSTAVANLNLMTTSTIYDTAIDNGVFYVVGNFTKVGTITRNRAAAFNVSTGALLPWDPNLNSEAYSVAVNAGIVYLGGAFTTINGSSTYRYLAAVPTTTVSASTNSATPLLWNANPNNSIWAITVDAANDRLYVGGNFTTIGSGSPTRNRAATLPYASLSGSVTPTAGAFNPNLNVTVFSIEVLGASVYLGGAFTTVGGVSSRTYGVKVAAADGAFLASYSLNERVNAIALYSGNVYFGGSFTSAGGATRRYFATFATATDALAATDYPASSTVHSLTVDAANGWMFVGGAFTSFNNQSRRYVAAIVISSGMALSWDPDADSTVRSVSYDPSTQKVGIGGVFGFIARASGQSSAIVSAPTSGATDGALGAALQIGGTGSVNAIARDGNILYLGGDFLYVNGSARSRLAAIDLSTGTLTSWAPMVDDTVRALVVDPATGVVYVGGLFIKAGDVSRYRTAAFSASGTLMAWDPQVNNAVWAMALDSANGVMYLGGELTSVNLSAVTRNRAAAVNLSVGAATSWDAQITSSSTVRSIYIDTPNSTVYVGGNFTIAGGASRQGAAAFSTTTGLLTAWDPTVGRAALVNSISVIGATVYLGGDFTSVGGVTRNRAAAVAASPSVGALTSWDPNLNGTVTAMLSDGNGSLVVGGTFSTVGATTRNRLAALDALTATATAWNPNMSSTVSALLLGPAANQVIAGGVFSSAGGVTRLSIASWTGPVTAAAALDSLIATSAAGSGAVWDIAVVGTTAYLVGDFTFVNGISRKRAAAIDITSGTLLPWDPNLNSTAWVVGHDPTTSSIYIGGAFTSVLNGASGRAYAAGFNVDASTTTLLSWAPSFNSVVRALAVSGSRVYLGGDFTTLGGVPRQRLAAVSTSPTAATDSGWDPQITNGSVNDLAVDSGVVYAVGTFTTVNSSTTRNRAAAFSAATGVSSSWNPNFDATANTVGVDPATATVYVGGSFTLVNGSSTRVGLAAVDLTSGTATAFNPSDMTSVLSISIDSTRRVLYLGGTFQRLSGLYRNRTGAINLDDGTVFPWHPGASSSVYVIAPMPVTGDVLVGGTFNRSNYVDQRGGYYRTSTAQGGALLTSLQSGQVMALPGGSVYTSLAADNKLYVAGDFGSVNGVLARRFAVLDASTLLPLAGYSAIGVNAVVRSIALDPTGTYVYLAGDFSAAQGSNSLGGFGNRYYHSAWRLSDATLTPWGGQNNPDGVVNTLAVLPDGTVLAGGAFTAISGAYRNRVVSLTAAPRPSTANSWDPSPNATVRSLAVDATSSTVYLGGDFTAFNTTTLRNRMAAVSLSTGAVSSWNPNVSATVRALTLGSDGTVYFGGDFTIVGGTTRNRAAAVTSGGSLTSFDPNVGNNIVYSVTVDDGAGRVYLGGTFTTAGASPVTRNRLLSASSSTGALTSWAPSVTNNSVFWTGLQIPTKRVLVGGSFTQIGSTTTAGLASIT